MWKLAYQKHGFVVSGQRSHLTNAYCNIVCFVLRPSFLCFLFFRRTLYSVKEVVDCFLLPLATTRLTKANLIVISLLLIMAILWLHNCHTTGFHSWEPWSSTFCGFRMMGVILFVKLEIRYHKKTRESVNGRQWEYRERSQRAKICRKTNK